MLRPGGALKIAEVKSRIKSNAQFVDTVHAAGFVTVSQDGGNKMFAEVRLWQYATRVVLLQGSARVVLGGGTSGLRTGG